MSTHLIGSFVTLTVTTAISCFLTMPVGAQAPTDPAGSALADLAAHAKVPTGPAPRLADGKPDFSGIWSPDRHFINDISDALKKVRQAPHTTVGAKGGQGPHVERRS